MSFKEVIMHALVCDNCGQQGVEESEVAGWDDKDWALTEAAESGWLTIDGNNYDKHYCPKCYKYDENDNLIIKKEKTKQ